MMQECMCSMYLLMKDRDSCSRQTDGHLQTERGDICIVQA